MSNYNFAPFKSKTSEVLGWLSKELSTIRTGRATPMILEQVMVKAYDSKVPIKQIASISIEDARSLKVTPWDKSQTKDIESAISQANLGVSVSGDSTGLRVIFPSLTEEGRNNLMKLVKNKVEEAKVTIRGEREKVWNDIQSKAKEGEISEDDKFKGKTDLQKLVDERNAEIEALASKKEKEIAS